jgi:endonuclease YncB( thermonuclease family)
MLKFWLLIPILLITGCSPEIADTREVRTGGAEWELVKNSVYDGDTFRVVHSKTGEKLKIRMACIDAPEKKQDLGIASRDYLRSLLNQNPDKITLSGSGKDIYGKREVAEVFLPDPKNPGNEMMIKSGYAYFYADYASACKDNSAMYAQFEKEAKAGKVGVWAKNSTKPWDYRKTKKAKQND